MKQISANRRDFLKAATAGAGCALFFGKKEAAMTTSESSAEIKYWMHGFGGDTPRDTAQALRDAGFDVVVAGGDAVIKAVTAAGMKSWLCGGGFPLVRDDDTVKAVDINGTPQVWFGSGSPNCPEVRDASIKSYENMVKTEGITGILVDGCRFASPASGLMPFLTDFSEYSRKKAEELDFDFALMKRDVSLLYDALKGVENSAKRSCNWVSTPAGLTEWLVAHPGIYEWLRFRRACTTEHFRTLSEIIHGAGLLMGVYIFTPCLAPLVGQSYEDLCGFVDVFAPMIYRNYPDRPGPACLNWELAELPLELQCDDAAHEATVMNMILSWAGFADLNLERRVAAVQRALPPAAVGRETQRSRALVGHKELAPIIYIDDLDMAATAEGVRAAGADGINFFVYKENWADMTRPAFS